MNEFTVISVNISEAKGTVKVPVAGIELRPGHGVTGDAHAGPWHRQVSLLAEESIARMKAAGHAVKPGDFAENITTRGVVLPDLPIGTRLFIGTCKLEVTQIGKECHSGCAIFKAVGSCVMPHEGIFARVLTGGWIHAQDRGHYGV
ncbi:MAG: MOSC domain-containing protein [Planctomycetota bacterium]